MHNTVDEYKVEINRSRALFEKKMHDYGLAWRILRISSLTDQLFIKASRIRTIEETQENLVGESVRAEYVGIVNYCLMGLIQQELGASFDNQLSNDEVLRLYDKKSREAFELMMRKNHDYGEAWRGMRITSYTDLILMKILRTKQIESNHGQTLVSEGIAANYADMLNYAIFALIRITEEENAKKNRE